MAVDHDAGGFEFQLLDRSGGGLSLPQFFNAAGRLIQNANAQPELQGVFTQFSPEAPQLQITVDRARLASLGIDSTHPINAEQVKAEH